MIWRRWAPSRPRPTSGSGCRRTSTRDGVPRDLRRDRRARRRPSGWRVLGGDLTRSPVLSLCVTAIGRAPSAERDGRPRRRRRRRRVCVTGPLGGAAAGSDAARPSRARRARCPTRSRSAVAAASSSPTRGSPPDGRWPPPAPSAMIDVSDGLGADAEHLAAASGVGIEIELDRVPVGAGVAEVAAAAGRDPARPRGRGRRGLRAALRGAARARSTPAPTPSRAPGSICHEIGRRSSPSRAGGSGSGFPGAAQLGHQATTTSAADGSRLWRTPIRSRMATATRCELTSYSPRETRRWTSASCSSWHPLNLFPLTSLGRTCTPPIDSTRASFSASDGRPAIRPDASRTGGEPGSGATAGGGRDAARGNPDRRGVPAPRMLPLGPAGGRFRPSAPAAATQLEQPADHAAPEQARAPADLAVLDHQQQVPEGARARGRAAPTRSRSRSGPASSDSGHGRRSRAARGGPEARAASSQTCAVGASSSAR